MLITTARPRFDSAPQFFEWNPVAIWVYVYGVAPPRFASAKEDGIMSTVRSFHIKGASAASLNSRRSALLITLGYVLIMTILQPAQAQTFTVLHQFTGGTDGGSPASGLALDAHGNLYGATEGGHGGVFKVAPHGSGWVFTSLYNFPGGYNGQNPAFGVTIALDGTLYGTTIFGGNGGCEPYEQGCGTVFRLQPPPTFCRSVLCPWNQTILYRYAAQGTGYGPFTNITFDRSGNLYGGTEWGSTSGNCNPEACGVIYQLTPSNGGWTENVIYNFTNGSDGNIAQSGLAVDNAGNIYGVTYNGGTIGCGTVFELSPSQSGWIETTIHDFDYYDGCGAAPAPILDQTGNLWVTTAGGADNNTGTLVEFTNRNGNWAESVRHVFSVENEGVKFGFVIDSLGNFYGTTTEGGQNGFGTAFKLTQSAGSFTETTLYVFTSHDDGRLPFGVVLDPSGNLFGTASAAGMYGLGTLWEIKP